jgi:hypothetical protein
VPNSALQPASSEGESRRGFRTARAASTKSSSLIILGASLEPDKSLLRILTILKIPSPRSKRPCEALLNSMFTTEGRFNCSRNSILRSEWRACMELRVLNNNPSVQVLCRNRAAWAASSRPPLDETTPFCWAHRGHVLGEKGAVASDLRTNPGCIRAAFPTPTSCDRTPCSLAALPPVRRFASTRRRLTAKASQLPRSDPPHPLIPLYEWPTIHSKLSEMPLPRIGHSSSK